MPTELQGQRMVLAVNAGSSTLKFGLYAAPDAPAVWSGCFEGLEPGGQPCWHASGISARLAAHADGPWPAALALLADALADAGVRLDAVVHRIVHGGETNYVLATVGLYVSIFNLFSSLLSLFGLGGSDE